MTPSLTALTPPSSSRRPARRLGAAVLAIGLLASGAVWSQAQPAMQHGMPAGHPFAGGGMAFGRHGGPLMAGRALDSVGATVEQKARVREIFKAALDELRPQHEAGRAMHQQMLALMTAPQVDAAAVEALRQQQSARHDAASKRMLQAMLDAQAVLTPEQRIKLGEQMKARQEMMQRHRHERRALEAPRS